MKKYLRLTLFGLILMLITGTAISAQIRDQSNQLRDNPHDIIVGYTIGSVQDFDYFRTRTLEPFFREVSYIVESSYGLTVDFIEIFPRPKQIDNTVDTYLYFSDVFTWDRIIIDTGISITTQADFLEEISPLLHSNRGIYLELSRNSTAPLLAALLGYSVNRCDLIQEQLPYFIAHVPSENNIQNILSIFIGNCYLAQYDFDTAVTYLDDLIFDNFGNFRGWNYAWTSLQVGQQEEAFLFITKGIEFHKLFQEYNQVIELLIFRAQLHALNFDYDSAIADMDSAIALDPDNPELYVLRGQMVLLLYEWNRVAENYNTALEIDPNYAPAYFYRGILYYTNLFREDALADFERYLEIAPNGDHADDATRYADSIRAEMEALGD
ncbi:MAG: hypothetical protein RLP44_06050 [Aggregatilineales bacterium]